jgi:hypothetical protein
VASRGVSRFRTWTYQAMMAEDGDFLRPIVRTVIQEFLEAEMTEAIGAQKGERVEGLGYEIEREAQKLERRHSLKESRDHVVSQPHVASLSQSALGEYPDQACRRVSSYYWFLRIAPLKYFASISPTSRACAKKKIGTFAIALRLLSDRRERRERTHPVGNEIRHDQT